MASPITTGGFNVSVMPGVSYLDPRLLAVDYGQLVPYASRGAALGQQFAQIADDRVMNPLRQKLAQIQIENAPLERQYRLAQIAEAQQNAAVPRIVSGDTTIEDMTHTYPAALDESGNRTGPDDRVLGDLVQIQTEDMYGPGGVKTTRQIRKTIKTASQRQAEEDAAAARNASLIALANQRNRGKEYEIESLNNLLQDAKASGDTEAEAIYQARINKLNTTAQSPAFRIASSGQDANGNLVINLIDKDGVLHSVPTGQKKTISQMEALIASLGGGAQAAKPAAQPSAEQAIDADVNELVNLVSGKKPSVTAVSVTYKSPDDVKAAYKSGRLNRAQAEEILRSQFGLK